MQLSTKYDPTEVESKWYQQWMDAGYFRSTPNPQKEPYCIVIPPPNVTGVLHMGHMLNNTIQDILVRRARMQGKEACWVPGTDHASIATEAKVVAMLRERASASAGRCIIASGRDTCHRLARFPASAELEVQVVSRSRPMS